MGSQMTPAKQNWLLDERLLQSQKLAAIGQLSAGIAHEINNPLAIIRQEAEWMRHLLAKAAALAPQEREELSGSVQQIVSYADFENLRYGILTARRAWATPENVLNTWPVERFKQWLKNRKQDAQW